MAGRDIKIPFGPDKSGGIPMDAVPAEDALSQAHDFAGSPPSSESLAASLPGFDSNQVTAQESGYVVPEAIPEAVPEAAPYGEDPQAEGRDVDYHPGGLTDEEATAQGMDDIQMSILALKDSIGQGRELKEREKEREELAEALEADHVELADREDILANYQALVAEQDAIVDGCTQKREAAKSELSQLTVALEQAQGELEYLREQHAQLLQPIEGDLGRARAAADQAKNDERSRKSELNAAEAELRKANEADANTMEVARHQQVQAAYEEARVRSEQAKEQLAQVQKAYDEAKQRAEQAQGPLERNIADYNNRMAALKEDIAELGDNISAAMNRRQYCDTVYQYPDETAKMRAEIEQAEVVARQMDDENAVLREQLAQSKQKARKAKVAIAVVIVIIVVIVVSFIVLSGR